MRRFYVPRIPLGNTSLVIPSAPMNVAIAGPGITQITPSAGAIVFKPGIRPRIGGYASMQSLASLKAVTDSLWGPGGSDINNRLLGVCLSPTWRQLEGDTQGDYSAGFAAIGAIISLMKSYSPPKDVSIFINGGGNGWTAQSSAPGGFCPTYMQNSTYGGGMVWSGLDRPYIVVWNQQVVNRLIALVQAYNTQFGPDTATGGIYRWDTYQEISINAAAPGYSPSALLAVWPSWMAGIRAAAPQTMIIAKPTFINPNTGASYPSILSNMLSNSISMSSEDCSGSGNNDWAQTSYRGGFAGFTTTDYTQSNGGNPGWDFHCNVDPGELWNTSNGNAAIPPATTGSGYIYDVTGGGIWTKVNQLKASHVDIYIDASGGPNVNRRVFSASAPANPPLGPGAGLVAANPNIIDVLTGNTSQSGVLANGCAIPWNTYPPTYPSVVPAPLAITPIPDVLGGAVDVFFTGPDARSISPLTQYTATLLSGGVSTGNSATVSRNPTTGMLSAYVRLYGITPGTYTVSVTATNANGTSTPVSSSAFTVTAPSDYIISGGAASSAGVPQHAGWGAYGGSGANSYADTSRVFPGQTNSILVVSGGLILPFYQSIWCSAGVNGNLYLTPWKFLRLKVFGTTFAAEVNISFRWCSHSFSVSSTGGTNTFTDNSQNFVANGLVNGAGSIQVFGTGKAMNAGAGCSNTVNSVTDSNGGGFNWPAAGGQRWIASYGDQDFVRGSTNSQPGVGGISSYTIAQYDPSSGAQVGSVNSFQVGKWNEVAIPLSVMNHVSGASGNYPQFLYPGAIQELRVQNLSGNSNINITDLRFTVN